MIPTAELLRRVRGIVFHQRQRLTGAERLLANHGFELFDIEAAKLELALWRSIEKSLTKLVHRDGSNSARFG
ncbi:hypothetical protein [Caulifigura coniformis]|uniref:hypothetical protein n=1 Tax=Caulifigura coniformis TaxID=2527983 RepID=UPI0011AA0573|nr:hypothetical protein [Caulifigura coniformis]